MNLNRRRVLRVRLYCIGGGYRDRWSAVASSYREIEREKIFPSSTAVSYHGYTCTPHRRVRPFCRSHFSPGGRCSGIQALSPKTDKVEIESEVRTDDELSRYHTSPANPVWPAHDPVHPELVATNPEPHRRSFVKTLQRRGKRTFAGLKSTSHSR